jgi:hypothetical protein
MKKLLLFFSIFISSVTFAQPKELNNFYIVTESYLSHQLDYTNAVVFQNFLKLALDNPDSKYYQDFIALNKNDKKSISDQDFEELSMKFNLPKKYFYHIPKLPDIVENFKSGDINYFSYVYLVSVQDREKTNKLLNDLNYDFFNKLFYDIIILKVNFNELGMILDKIRNSKETFREVDYGVLMGERKFFFISSKQVFDNFCHNPEFSNKLLEMEKTSNELLLDSDKTQLLENCH